MVCVVCFTVGVYDLVDLRFMPAGIGAKYITELQDLIGTQILTGVYIIGADPSGQLLHLFVKAFVVDEEFLKCKLAEATRATLVNKLKQLLNANDIEGLYRWANQVINKLASL